MKFPVFDRSCGQNVFDWIIQAAEGVRHNRQLIREMEYRKVLEKKEQSDGKSFKEVRKEKGEGSKPAATFKAPKTRARKAAVVEATIREVT